jgi:hypothetical protein
MKITYNDNEGLKVIHPAIDIDINIIADKDVPSGLYYKIIQDSDLPSREFRNAWELEINESNSDGIGLTKEQFKTKYPDYKGMAVQ